MWALVHGFGLCAGLIMAIGAQNAFVLRQAATRQHVFAVALVSGLCDTVLISAGVLGLGLLMVNWPIFVPVMKVLGVAFLVVFGWKSLLRVFQPAGLHSGEGESVSLSRTLMLAMGFSLLNPHAWLDTTILLGSSAQQYVAGARASFTVGAVLASFCWFFALAYGARALGPWLTRPSVWRVVDALVAAMMFGLALMLVIG